MKQIVEKTQARFNETTAEHGAASENLLTTIHEVCASINAAKGDLEYMIGLYQEVGGHDRLVKRLTCARLELDGLPKKLNEAWGRDMMASINFSQASVDNFLVAALDAVARKQ